MLNSAYIIYTVYDRNIKNKSKEVFTIKIRIAANLVGRREL